MHLLRYGMKFLQFEQIDSGRTFSSGNELKKEEDVFTTMILMLATKMSDLSSLFQMYVPTS